MNALERARRFVRGSSASGWVNAEGQYMSLDDLCEVLELATSAERRMTAPKTKRLKQARVATDVSGPISPLSADDLGSIAAKVARDPGDPLALEATFLLAEVTRLRRVCATAAADLVRECIAKDIDTMWHSDGCTLWELLNMNGDVLEEPVASEALL